MKRTMSRRSFQKVWTGRQGLALSVVPRPDGFLVRDGAWKDSEFGPSITLRITPDEVITASIDKPGIEQEFGFQELHSVLADELNADGRNIRIRSSSSENARQGTPPLLLNGEDAVSKPLRVAAAAAREMLLHAAARAWNVGINECCAVLGKIRHLKTNRMVSYGQVTERASKLAVPQNPLLKAGPAAGSPGQPALPALSGTATAGTGLWGRTT